MIFNIHQDYSEDTGIRHSKFSETSGEDFYHDKLNEIFHECYTKNEVLELVLDGGDDGYTPSFLDESIGNLVYDFTLDVVKSLLLIVSNWEPYWIDEIEKKTYPKWEERRKKGEQATITKEHGAWYRLVDGAPVKRVWIEYTEELQQ